MVSGRPRPIGIAWEHHACFTYLNCCHTNFNYLIHNCLRAPCLLHTFQLLSHKFHLLSQKFQMLVTRMIQSCHIYNTPQNILWHQVRVSFAPRYLTTLIWPDYTALVTWLHWTKLQAWGKLRARTWTMMMIAMLIFAPGQWWCNFNDHDGSNGIGEDILAFWG